MDMTPKPTDEHFWLTQLVGTWKTETTCDTGAGNPVSTTQGEERVRTLGPYWVLIEGRGEMPGGAPFEMLSQIGFDAATGRFRGTWIGSPMAMLWVYDGWLDQSRQVLTLGAQGPSMAGDGSIADYEDIIEVSHTGERSFRSRMRRPDGSWHEFMRTRYVRTGA